MPTGVFKRHNSPWTEERVELVRRLAPDFSCERIAEELGGDFTRNSVIGKMRREKISGRPWGSRLMPKASIDERSSVAQRIRKAPADNFDIPQEQRCAFFELRPQNCRWPIGDPSEKSFFFCGAVPETGFPYCAGHCVRAYDPQKPRRRVVYVRAA